VAEIATFSIHALPHVAFFGVNFHGLDGRDRSSACIARVRRSELKTGGPMKRAFLVALLAFGFSGASVPARASLITYQAVLSGANESPPNNSLGTGLAVVTVDDIADTIRIMATFSGLTTNDTAAHIHCCTAAPGTGTAGVATAVPAFPGFPLMVMAGTYDMTFALLDPAFYNPAFVTALGGSLVAARATLLTGLAAGETYFNIHTTLNPGGEIRGFLTPAPVPEPTSITLLGLGIAGIFARRRRH
jgi:hypothetical protein